MRHNPLQIYAEQRQRYCGKELLYHTIAYHGAPVLEGLRPAVLLVFTPGKHDLAALWRRYRRELVGTSPLSFYQLKTSSRGVAVLFYRPELLEKVLLDPRNQAFLERCGYDVQASLLQKLSRLRRCFQQDCCHEIGLFLGIPLEDVVGFINCKGKHPICCGCWKVYHQPLRAQKLFALFTEAKRKYLEVVRAGWNPGDFLLSLTA